jgi:hypothetical protein
MNQFFEKFQNQLWIKKTPSAQELELFAKTQKYMKFISWIPGLRMVAICNSLSMYASDADSDIDLFMVAEKNRMWFVRILVTIIFQILWVRRHGNKISGRFCLSFFATTAGLNFGNFRIENDIYLAYWIYHLKPILDKWDTHENLRNLNVNWTSEFFETTKHHEDEKKYLIKKSGSSLKQSIFLDKIDTILKKIFLPKTIAHRESLGNPIGIIVSENMLKFHNNDRREEIKKSLG